MNMARLNGQIPLGYMTGKTPNIFQYLDFGYYNYIQFKENAGLNIPSIDKFLGIVKSV